MTTSSENAAKCRYGQAGDLPGEGDEIDGEPLRVLERLAPLFDCPHGNWWFLVWHRGYLGWFERTCRELTGESDFSLPFWDWSAEPAIPVGFWDDVFDPDHASFEADVASFRQRFRAPAEAYWNNLSSAQRDQQTMRRVADFDAFWNLPFGAENDFFERGRTRRLTESDPNLDSVTQQLVSEQVVEDILAAPRYVSDTGNASFETGRAGSHHDRTSFSSSLLEGQPHDNVHGSISGFMGRFLSPVDPIFFMHHSNIDRLWDVWTRKQLNAAEPHEVPAALRQMFSAEPFLFFHDEHGTSVQQSTAGDYFDIGDFDYSYEAGTGEDRVGAPIAELAVPSAAVSDLAASFDLGEAARASVALPRSLAESLAEAEAGHFFATVTLTPPDNVDDLVFDVFVAPMGEGIDPSTEGDNFAGRISFFGGNRHPGMASSFTVGITRVVQRMRERGTLGAGEELDIAVVPELAAGRPALSGSAQGVLNGAAVGAF